MRSTLRQLLRSSRSRPKPRQYSNHITTMTASVGTGALALGMTAYACSVTQQPLSDKTPSDAKAHHVKNRHGKTTKFQNPHPSHVAPSVWDMMSTGLGALFGFTEWPKPKLTDQIVPVVKPHFLPTRTSSSKLRATWLGHACYYVEYPSGLRVLFDPVFEDCCAPINMSMVRRYTERPCDIADLPFVDAVVISHSHYDHLSYPSVQEIQKHHPNAHFFVGLGLEKWFKSSGVPNVTEMDWWDEIDITLTPSPSKDTDSAVSMKQDPIKARISCLPSQHTSGRTGLDRDSTLWASWGVQSGNPSKTVWFGGDTGYRTVPKVPKGVDDWGADYAHLPVCPQFKQIGQRLGSVDLGLIPIGAYHPRHVFSHMHSNPHDAVEIFKDTRCSRAMAIHWGTWALTPEPPLEPPKILREALKRRGFPETGVFDVCNIGESREF
ncbi:NAPE-hydrolyzing phospholipase D [Xylariaceae sp. FL0016]|nr:NAPE-hydrolyzing phospholipase D [Xylariaceae sp. FL0016]